MKKINKFEKRFKYILFTVLVGIVAMIFLNNTLRNNFYNWISNMLLNYPPLGMLSVVILVESLIFALIITFIRILEE